MIYTHNIWCIDIRVNGDRLSVGYKLLIFVIEFQPVLPLQGELAGLYSLDAKLRDYRAPLAGVARREYLGLARDAGALAMISFER